MTKKFVTVICIVLTTLIGAYAGISVWFGSRIQTETRAGLDAINEHLANRGIKPITVKESGYQRGIFSSQVSYLISVPSVSPEVKPLQIQVLTDIDHGPLPLHALLKGQLSPALAIAHSRLIATESTQSLFTITKGQSFIDGRSIIKLNGKIELNWTALPLDFTQNDIHSVFSGAQLNASVDANFKAWQGDVAIDAIDLTNPNAALKLSGIRLYTNSQESQTGLTVGTRGISVETMQASYTGLPAINLKKLETRFVLNENSDLLDGVANYDINQLTIGTKELGSFNFLASLDHLNAGAINSLADLHHNVLVRSLNNAADEDLVTNSDVKAFWQQVQILLKDKPALHINPMSWKTNNGESEFTLHMSLGPVDPGVNGVGLTGNPIQAFHATLNLSKAMLINLWAEIKQASGAPESKARQSAEKEVTAAIIMANVMKLAKVSGDNITTNLTLDQKTFKLNGNAIPTNSIMPWLESVTPSGWLSDDSPAAQEDSDEGSARQHLAPETLATILSTTGYKHEERKDEQGDPIIQVAPEETGATKIDFIFVGCGSDPTCEDVLLRASFDQGQPDALKVVNEWNRKNRWARAYVNKTQEPIIEMDINAYGGISKDSVQSMITSFFGIVKDFAKELKPVGDAR